MWLTIAGLLIATLAAIVSAETGEGSKTKKRALSLLAVVGLIVGSIASFTAELEKTEEATKHELEVEKLNGQLASANAALTEVRKAQADQDPLLRYVSASVGDLGRLNVLSGGYRYYVRIAWANNEKGRRDLEATKNRILNEFKGADASGMVAILSDPKIKGAVQLVFGRELSFAAAEVFLRLALSHQLANGQPQIFSESEGASRAK